MAGTAAGAAKRKMALAAAPTTQYVVGTLPLRLGDQVLMPGDPVPGAQDWPRVESWVRTGRITAA